jgi:hypothetical protein
MNILNIIYEKIIKVMFKIILIFNEIKFMIIFLKKGKFIYIILDFVFINFISLNFLFL